MDRTKIDKMIDQVAKLEELGRSLAAETADFPALNRNAARLLASVKMMKLNLGLSRGSE